MWISTIINCCLVAFGLLKLNRWRLRRTWGSVDKSNEVSARNRIVVITGANAGIGRATALEFACRDAVVILACRDASRAAAAVNWIRKETSLGQLIYMKLDLASLESVREFCKEFQAKYDRLDILVNNAGIMMPPEEKRRTVEGFEIHMGVNHLAHFLLTNLLLDSLRKAAASRIVIVSSLTHSWRTLDLDDIMSEQKTNQASSLSELVSNALYCRSKLANALFNKELARRLKGTGVNTYGLCTGMVATDVTRHMTGLTALLMKPIYPFLSYTILKTPQEGAATTMYCALSKSVTNESGKMYEHCGYWDPKDRAILNDEDAERLWEESEKLVGL